MYKYNNHVFVTQRLRKWALIQGRAHQNNILAFKLIGYLVGGLLLFYLANVCGSWKGRVTHDRSPLQVTHKGPK